MTKRRVELLGQTLLDMADETSTMPLSGQSKALMRTLINHLGDQALHTRQLLRDLQALDSRT